MKKPRLTCHKREAVILRNNLPGFEGTFFANRITVSPKRHCHTDFSVNGRPLLTSKKICEPLIIRKPVPECYCNAGTRKAQNKPRRALARPTFPCNHSQSQRNLQVAEITDTIPKTATLFPALSCETLRKVQSIVYSPRSKFLRSKLAQVNLKQDVTDDTSSDSIITVIKCPRGKLKPKKDKNKTGSYLSKQESNVCLQKSTSVCPFKLKCLKSKNFQVSNKSLPAKKTVVSKKTNQVACSFCRKFSCIGSCRLKSMKPVTPRTSRTSDGCYAVLNDDDVQELYKFREHNYFETHGSTYSSNSSDSGSLDQYLLNERFFPQPARKIHRRDVMVTMPTSFTKQNKRVHYFPHYLVSQERSKNCKTSQRSQRCPLTGHSIDIGLLKNQHLSNSLALRYQKATP